MKWKILGWLIVFGLPSVHPKSLSYPVLRCPPEAEVTACAGCWSKCPIAGKKCNAGSGCKKGCMCKEPGYVLHNSVCMPRSECPYIPQEGRKCPVNMQWKPCSYCNDYCPVHGQKCIKMCRTGCVCRENYLMHFGTCFYKLSCPQTFLFIPSCPKGTKWHECAPCKSYCFPEKKCSKECVQGCICKNPDLVLHDGRCIKKKDCPLLNS
ncbi:serine protease inhibitor swm-1-like [Bufo gargarizans]|uniref:serine protease inhibitor swm-1-like n=1 Tax=Bufo gargarizans TaxID=30331 RepID=UPI001CF179C4|nr:serine protease inhibitor swm-1-like [Bufo gargarizans]